MSGAAVEGGWPGRALGLPPEGAGSLARLGRRVAALVVDWLTALLVSNAFLSAEPFATLAVFAAVQWVFVAVTGSSPGHRLLGMRVVGEHGGAPGVVRAAARAVLLSLALPPVIVDRDQRGLHDRLVHTVLVRR